MKKKKKELVIEFAMRDDTHKIPQSSKTVIPDWYKKTSFYPDGNTMFSANQTPTFKRCVPFMDAMISGYIAELWCDILVKNVHGQIILEWRNMVDPLHERDISATISLPVPSGHAQQRFAWNVPYFMRTPKGYSSLITHPLNRHDLPFTVLSAIVDTDEVMYGGSMPFFIKEGFEGVIPKGTPLFQIIPFKRENWESIENKELISIGNKNNKLSFSYLYGWYKTQVWKKKTYN